MTESSADKEKRLVRRAASQTFHRRAFRRSMRYQMANPVRQQLKEKGLTDEEIDTAIHDGEQEFFGTVRKLDEIIDEANKSGRDTMAYVLPEFEKFPKIPRLNRDIIITEKIDGTNAQIFIPEDDRPVLAGSRNRWLRPAQSDNFGFAAWVEAHANELRQLGPGRHFGEWWGRGINRGYGLNERRFSLFNVSRWIDLSREYDRVRYILSNEAEAKRIIIPNCCYTVPVLYAGPLDEQKIQYCLFLLQTNGSSAAPGFMNPEGIVIYHTAGNCCFKVTIENDDKPKG